MLRTHSRRIPFIATLGAVAAASLVLAGCSSTPEASPSSSSSPAVPVDAQMTPVLASVPNSPIPFVGSDAKTWLVYELSLINFTSGATKLDKVEVLNADTGAVLKELSGKAIARATQPFGSSSPTDEDIADEAGTGSGAAAKLSTLPPASGALVFLDVAIDVDATVPTRLSHRLSLTAEAAPPGSQELTEEVPAIDVSSSQVPIGQNPLRGDGYVSADSCCANRHRRAALSINNEVFLAQRFAVDWEQVDSSGRIFQGDPADVNSYEIYGKDAHAFANATVAAAVDEYPDQVPQTVEDVNLQNADGNHVVLDLGNGNYVLYAHLIPGSLAVKVGDQVNAGDVIGKVGNSGNSIAPHLHFHVMDSASPLASSGVPYELSAFTVTAQVAGDTADQRTAAFDKAEAKGTVLPTVPSASDGARQDAFPLDQLIISMQ